MYGIGLLLALTSVFFRDSVPALSAVFLCLGGAMLIAAVLRAEEPMQRWVYGSALTGVIAGAAFVGLLPR